jgi:hypothetical protein
VARLNGTPEAPHVFVPTPIVGKSAAELRAYVEGDDPTTGRPLVEALLEGLTQDPGAPGAAGAQTHRLLEPGGEERLHELFLERGWTDQLPIVLPTEARVEAMLAHTDRAPDELIGTLRPAETRPAWSFTVEQVAVNAVMAGARPEYLPVILALAASGVTARHSSTTSLASMAVVNGPIRRQLGIGSGTGALGPYDHANATIGRAWGLLSQNLQGGSVRGESYMGSQGNAYAFSSMCFGENEEASPWPALHVQHGFAAEESVVSAFVGGRTTLFSMSLPDETWRELLARTFSAVESIRNPVLLADPLVARRLVELGFADKRDLAIWAAAHASLPAREFWALSENKLAYHPRAAAGEEPWASRLAAGPDAPIPLFRPQDLEIVVVGGETNTTWRVVSSTLLGQRSVDDFRPTVC